MEKDLKPFKYQVGDVAFRYGTRVKILEARRTSFGSAVYSVQGIYLGNVETFEAWETDLSKKR